MESGYSNMLENTRKYFQGIPSDAAAAAAAAAAGQLHYQPPSHHLHHNGSGGGGRASMNSSSEPPEDRFAGYHPHMRYNYQPYSSPGHYPRTAVDPKTSGYQHHHFQPPLLQFHHQQLPPSASPPSAAYKSPYQLQPPLPTVKQQQQQQQQQQLHHSLPPSSSAQSPFKPTATRPSSPTDKLYSPAKQHAQSPYPMSSGKPLQTPQSPYAVVPKPIATAPPPPQSPFTALKEQHVPSVPETPPPTPHSSHYYSRTSHCGVQQQQAIDRDYLQFKPIQTPPPPASRFQPLERPKSEVPVGVTGPQSSHLAIRYDPKLEQPRSGVRAVPIAQAKQSSSATPHDINRVIVQKPEPLRYHQQQLSPHHQHRSSSSLAADDRHHQKRPASVQPSYLESRPFQIKPYEGNSNGSSSNGSSSNGGQSSSASSYHRPFSVAPPLPPSSSQASAATGVLDHRWTAFGRQDAPRTPAFLQQPPASSAVVINGGYNHRQPISSSSLSVAVSQQHHQQHHSSSLSTTSTSLSTSASASRQQQSPHHYPLNLNKLTQPARPATAAGQLQQVKIGQDNHTASATKQLRFETKRESPLDLSVKTVCRSADSTDDRLHPFGHDIPKVNFKPDFNACRGLSLSSLPPGTVSNGPPPGVVVVVGGQQHNNAAGGYHHLPPQITLPPTAVVASSQQPLAAAAPATVLPIPLPPVVHHNHQAPMISSAADDTWRAAIDRQIEQKFNSYTSTKKQHHHQQPPVLQHQQLPLPTTPQQQQQQHQGAPQADKRVLEILKQNIEARDQSGGRPQIAEAPSTPAMDFPTPIRKEPSTTPLKKTDYYMAERTAVTPFPKKIDYYMDRAYCNAPRIRTKAERKQVSAEGSSSGMRINSPMAAATAISPHPFLPSNNGTPQTKQEQTPLTQTEVVVEPKLEIERDPPPIKNPELSSLDIENTEKDDDDEFWMNTCNSFVVQLAETQEKKNDKSPVKRKSPKEQQSQPAKRKYTKRIKIGPVSESEQDQKSSDLKENVINPSEEVKSEKSHLKENIVPDDDKLTKTAKTEVLDVNKENETKLLDQENKVDGIKEKEDDQEEVGKVKPKSKRLSTLNLAKRLVLKKVKKIKMEEKRNLKMKKVKKDDKKELKKEDKKVLKKEEKKEPKKEEKKELKKEEKKELKKEEKKELKKEEKKEIKKGEKKEAVRKESVLQKEDKKPLKKEEKRGDHKKDQQQDKKDVNKKDGKKTETLRKKAAAAEKENVTKNHENMISRRSLAAADAPGKLNPRQSLRRKNSLKDYTYAFDELLDDALAHFEADKIPVKRKRKCVSPPPPSLTPAVVPAPVVAAKKVKEKDNETIRMRLRSRSRPHAAKQEPQKAAKKNPYGKNKNVPKKRQKKSLGEKKSAPSGSEDKSSTDNWKSELYEFKRALRMPSKLISVVSPPTAGAVAPDQVSLTSIMHIPSPHKLTKTGKSALLSSQSQAALASAAVSKNLGKRLGLKFGRRDVFKGRRLMKRDKIVSAEKLLQRNLRKRRQQEDVGKKDEEEEEEVGSRAGDEETTPIAAASSSASAREVVVAGKKGGNAGGTKRIMLKRKFMRKKFRSGFDYIKKKKKKEPASEKKPVAVVPAAAASVPPPKCEPRFVSEIQADIKGWIVNKGLGETVLHRAARLGVKDVVGFCIEKLEYAPSVADNAGYTPLHEACSQGHYHIAKLLLQFGADVSASAQGGIRPLHEAVENGDVHLVRLLLGYGADPHLATYSGQSPLSLATDIQTRMLLEHHVNDVQGRKASVWNFDDTALNREPEDVDRLLWCSPPHPPLSSLSVDDDLTFDFEFADQSLPDVYKLSVDDKAPQDATDGGGTTVTAPPDEWVLFADVSAALSVKTADALAKLLDDKNAVVAVPVDRFNERAVPRKILGRQPPPVRVTSSSVVKSSAAATKSPSAAVKDTKAPVTDDDDAAAVKAESGGAASSTEQVLLVRYDRKLKQLLGVDVYTTS